MASGIHKITNEQDVNVEKWSPPPMGSSKNQVFEAEKAKVKSEPEPEQEIESAPIPTAEEIEKWHAEAHEEGYQQGLTKAEQEIAQQKKQILEIFLHDDLF